MKKNLRVLTQGNKDLLTLLVIFFLALVLRLVLSPLGFHLDILSQAYWGDWIFKNGPFGFYDNNVWVYSWPTQPPLVNLSYAAGAYIYFYSLEFFRYLSSYVVPHLAPGHMLWWFDFVKWYDNERYPESYMKIGYFMSIKFIGMLADLGIALTLYLIAKRNSSNKRALFLTLAYLFMPFSWYISAFWGQYDQLSYLFLLISFLLIFKRWLVLAPAVFVISAGLKPTSIIYLPFFIFIYLRFKPKVWEVIFGFVLSMFVLFTTARIFTDRNIFYFYYYDLVSKVIYKSGFRVSTNSFNFWHILIGNRAYEQDTKFLFLPSNYWGNLAFLIINIFAFKVSWKKTYKNLFLGMTIIGMGGWLFLTNMLERYYFAGVTSLLFLTIYYPKLLKYWFAASLIFWINLYHGFWFPKSFEPFRLFLIANGNLATRVFALLNVLIFARILYLLKLLPVNKLGLKKIF